MNHQQKNELIRTCVRLEVHFDIILAKAAHPPSPLILLKKLIVVNLEQMLLESSVSSSLPHSMSAISSIDVALNPLLHKLSLLRDHF